MLMNEKLMLIDGHSILNRAYYGLPALTGEDGTPTGALYGFLNIMFKFIDEEKPEYLAVAFDVSEPTFRHKMYDGYKGTRKPMDPELKIQVPLIKDILRSMNIPVIEKAGFEADDIIGTLAKSYAGDGRPVTIVSGDKDLLQLVDKNITMKNPKTSRGQTTVVNYTPEDIKEEFGVSPHEFILLKAIMGDSSDNIPGVKGVGPKTAAPVVARYHTLENVIDHIEDLKPDGLRKKMEAGVDSIKISYKLAEIDTDVDLDFQVKDAHVGDFFNPDSYALFSKYNFKTMLNRVDKEDKLSRFVMPEIFYPSDISQAEEAVDKFKDTIRSGRSVGISIEKMEAGENIFAFLNGEYPAGISLAWEDGRAVHIGIVGDIDGDYLQNKCTEIIKLASECSDPGKIYINDLKEAIPALQYPEDEETDVFTDVALVGYLINPLAGEYTYSDLANTFLGAGLPGFKELKDDLKQAGALDAYIAFKLGDMLLDKLDEEDMRDLYLDIEKPLISVLASIEKEGIGVDKEALKQYGEDLTESIEALKREIYELAGEEFNILSPKVLGGILFEKLGLPHGKKTKTGYSTAAEVLEMLAPDHRIAEAIIEYRTLTKLKSTYAEGLYGFIETDGRIHGDFNQTVTATGRLSSTNPNLQNIPVRMEIGRKIRKVFIPKDGCVFIDADYSQIELRVLAHLSGDKKLIEAYRSARDIHTITASQVFGVPFDQVTPEQRRNAKAVNFGIIYGISSFGLGKGLSISVKEAKAYIDNYFKTYPAIKEFLDGLVKDAKEKGYSVTLFKRRRPITELRSKNFNLRSFGERVAMNAPIQGTAADIMKIAMIKVYNALKKEGLRSKLILQVHDEILVETAMDEKDRVEEIIRDSMENAVELKVPLTIDINEGKNWLEAH